MIPLDEAEWYGLDLNAACRKLQDLEDNAAPRPLKQAFEEELLEELRKEDEEAAKKKQQMEEAEIDEEADKERPLYPKNKWIGWRI